MRITIPALLLVLLVACGGGGNSTTSLVSNAQSKATVLPLQLGQPASISNGLSMAVLSLNASKCDSGKGLVAEVEWTNKTTQYIKDSPSLTVIAPDNQQLTQYIGIRREADGAAYDGYLPQGFPPNQTTKGFVCIPNGGQPYVSVYVGTLPSSFTNWIVRADTGQRWLVK